MARAMSSFPVPLSPAQIDTRVGPRHQGNLLEDLLHRRRHADNSLLDGSRRRRCLGRYRRRFERPADGALRHLKIERLDEIIEGAAADRLDRRLQFPVGRDENHRHRTEIGMEPFQRGQSVHAGQSNVEYDGIGSLAASHPDRLFGGSSRGYRVAHRLSQPCEAPADALFVIDNQQVSHLALRNSKSEFWVLDFAAESGYYSNGSSTVKQVILSSRSHPIRPR